MIYSILIQTLLITALATTSDQIVAIQSTN